MSDLVQRLRDPSQATCWGTADNMMNEAADRIEADAALLRQAQAVLGHYALEQRHLHKPGLTNTLAALHARLGETT